ncbi:MAG TPA: BACON domain-containing carbohydrate-binding protein, partial [Prolixibacteraceae bacterium]|nr:BACON domain-containing carbohydrate-binding protein [Prolixibacteraceae bacterium]
YWFDMNDRNFSNTYSQMMCARVWGNGYDRGTFWTGDIAAMYGIQMFPLTGASLYLGQNADYVKRLWNDMKAKTAVLSKTPNDNLWYDVYWSYLALADPATAISLYNDYPGYKVKGGCSDAQTYHWLHTFNGMGQMDATITADYPISAVFSKEGDKTYVTHNYGAKEITVTYSDGYKMTVPARTLKTSKDLDITAKLTASALQVSANESVTLSAETTGSGITKVEFYEGANLLGASTTAPYSVGISNLTTKVHSFYAKIYAGTSIKLSNAVSVIVGSQLPYGGSPINIPSQLIEAGNYDYYEGGIGQNISYFDVTSWNDAGTFRSPESVDAGATPAEGNTVGWIDNGEWLEYTVNIEKAGAYDLSVRYASGNTNGGGPFHIEVDGTTVAGNITVGFTSTNWSTWASKVIPDVILPAGNHVIKLAFDKGGFNIGKLSFTYKGEASPALSVSTKSIAMAPIANSTKTVDITSNIAWAAVSDQEWLMVSAATGFGNSTVTLTAQENPLTENRTATITVSGAGVNSQVITVTQDPGGVPYLILSASELSIGTTANSTQTFEITSNVNWTATSNQSWLTVSNAGGNGIAVITLTAQANTITSNRSATVTITGEGLAAKTITVTQQGAPALLTLPIDFETGTFAFTNFDGGTATVIDNPQKSGSNTSEKVARMIRNAGATWAGSYLTLNNKIDFTNLGYISMKVYSPKAGIPVLFKLEGDASPTEVSVKTTVANAWETLTWNFSGKPSNVYNKLVFMFDFGTQGNGTASSTFLFDDIIQGKTITGINVLDKTTVKIYPNPANNVLFIDGIQGKSTVTIFDSMGNILINKTADNYQMDISQLVNGVYTIRIANQTELFTSKFIKQ